MPAPARLTIPAIGVRTTVVAVGLVPGTSQVAVPSYRLAGWYRLGPSPGDPGSAVIVGHVDQGKHEGVFWRVRKLKPGDTITVDYTSGATRQFQVVGRQELAKQSLPAHLFSRQGGPTLTLITCGGPFDPATRHYRDNVVIVATPA